MCGELCAFVTVVNKNTFSRSLVWLGEEMIGSSSATSLKYIILIRLIIYYLFKIYNI